MPESDFKWKQSLLNRENLFFVDNAETSAFNKTCQHIIIDNMRMSPQMYTDKARVSQNLDTVAPVGPKPKGT